MTEFMLGDDVSSDILYIRNSYEFVMDVDKDIMVHSVTSLMLPEIGGVGVLSYLVVGIIFMFMSLCFGVRYLFNGMFKKRC